MSVQRKGFPLLGKFLNQLGFFRCQIIKFTTVLRQVIQFPGLDFFRPLIYLANQFPVSNADRAVSFMLPEDQFAFNFFPCKNGNQAASFQRSDRLTLVLFRILRSGNIDAGGHDVD